MSKVKFYWPDALEWLCFSFLSEKSYPRVALKQFYTKIIEDLVQQGKKQYFEGLNFCKNPAKLDYLDVNDRFRLDAILKDLIENFVPPQQKNVFFVLLTFECGNEAVVQEFANRLIKCNRFAVAAFPNMFLDYMPRTDRSFQKREEIFHGNNKDFLVDIVQLVVHRTNELKLTSSRPQSPTGASEYFDEDSSVKSYGSDVKLMRDGVAIPSTPKPLEIHLAENFRQSPPATVVSSKNSPDKADVTSADDNPPSAKMLSATAVSKQPSSESSTKIRSFTKVSDKFTAQMMASPSSMAAASFAQHQIIKPSSKLTHAKSETNLAAPSFGGLVSSSNCQSSSTVASRKSFAVSSVSHLSSLSPSKVVAPSAETAKRIYQSAFKPINLKTGDFYDVLVTHISNPSEFYVQPFVHREYLEWLNFRMQVFYALLDESPAVDFSMSYKEVVESPDIRQIWCAAPYAEVLPNGEPVWRYFRAKLLKRMAPQLFQVIFVDFGDTAVLPLNALKQLPDSFRNAGELAIHCRLVQPNISEDVLLPKVESRPNCVMKIENVDEDPILVSLILIDDKGNETNIGEVLTSQMRSMANGRGDEKVLLKSMGLGRGRKNRTIN